jgi:ribosomal 30S subunit maturation factor RimM
MFDCKTVGRIARTLGLSGLAKMTKKTEDYVSVLENYSSLMKKFKL